MNNTTWKSKIGSFDSKSPFMDELKRESDAVNAGEQILNVNGKQMGRAVYNLIISRRDLNMWTAEYSDGRPMKIKPHRHWKVSDVKTYFGIKGTGAQLLANFMALYNTFLGEDDD